MVPKYIPRIDPKWLIPIFELPGLICLNGLKMTGVSLRDCVKVQRKQNRTLKDEEPI